MWLSVWSDCLHMVQLMPLHPKATLSLASFKSRLVLPFCYLLTEVFLEKSSSSSSSSSSVHTSSMSVPIVRVHSCDERVADAGLFDAASYWSEHH